MENPDKIIRERRSVRTFDKRPLTREDREKLIAFAEKAENPFGLPVHFKLLEGMTSPVIVGTDLFIGGKMKKAPHWNEAFGYSFELFVLYAQSLGIGTTWIGGTMDCATFEKAMALDAEEVMPCVSPLGYPSDKMSLRETMMRKGVKADSRMNFEELFFDGGFDRPMTAETAGKWAFPLEMVRLAPSAVNKQPWRIVVTDSDVHFYLKRSNGFAAGTLDMQKIDVGIAMCHFDLAVQESGRSAEWILSEPSGISTSEAEYVATLRIL